MSVVVFGKQDQQVSAEHVRALAVNAGINIQEDHLDDFGKLLGAFDQSIQFVLDQDDYIIPVDLEKYPRSDIHCPEDTEKGGWATKCTARCTSPTSNLLQGKTIALKDNIALAGVKCTNGTEAMDWTPQFDAPIATRIMDAGGTITGKSACENASFESVSDTSCTGIVHNPYADGYSCNGSSSGSARLVAIGAVDMAIGCDQGGSIRDPASMCGIVGLKPTWGLVPYTGIISLDCVIDHAGPMTKTVIDAARLLQVIAGSDGMDDRQPPFLPDGTLDYISRLNHFLTTTDPNKPLAGFKIGLLKEAFEMRGIDPNISTLCHSAVDKLHDLGAEIIPISIPSHSTAAIVWMCSVPMAGIHQGFFSEMTGRKQFHMLDRVLASSNPVTQETFDALGPGAQNAYMRYLHVMKEYGPVIHAKSSNLLRKCNDDYDRALASVDVLVMPTLPQPPCRLLDNPPSHGPLARLSRQIGGVGNTAPFNSTGHPALTIPVGFVPAMDDKNIKLPAGLQIVGKKFRDIDCLKVGAAWERAYDWKTL